MKESMDRKILITPEKLTEKRIANDIAETIECFGNYYDSISYYSDKDFNIIQKVKVKL